MNAKFAYLVHQLTNLCELYLLNLAGGMEQKMERLRMFVGIERAQMFPPVGTQPAESAQQRRQA